MSNRLGAASKIASTLFIGKWTVKVVYLLKERPHPHGQLQRALGNISQRMLTRTLRSLESSGVICRKVTHSKRVAVEYSLTRLGKEFVVPLSSMCRWANRHSKRISANIDISKRGSGSRNRTQV
jgi:DNA-binding HxlR family transcriptional regulator